MTENTPRRVTYEELKKLDVRMNPRLEVSKPSVMRQIQTQQGEILNTSFSLDEALPVPREATAFSFAQGTRVTSFIVESDDFVYFPIIEITKPLNEAIALADFYRLHPNT